MTALCPTCETCAHCAKHGCIPVSGDAPGGAAHRVVCDGAFPKTTAPGFGIDAEQLERLRSNSLKPEEIAGAPDVQHKRVRELLHWFARLANRNANPKWAHQHAFELAYYLATEGTDRGLDLDAIEQAAFIRGTDLTAAEKGMLSRIAAAAAAPSPIPVVEAGPDLLQILTDVVALAKIAHGHWDADRDSKVGKLLLALAGWNQGYDRRADNLHAAIERMTTEAPK